MVNQVKPVTYLRLRLIILLCLISSLARFAMDSYLPSLPAIQISLNLTSSATQLTLTTYLLGFGFSQLLYGPLSDYMGRKKILLLGMNIFLIGMIICTFANSAAFLLFGRLIVGVGAGVCGVLNRAIAGDCFKGAEFAKVWSYTNTALVFTLILAPLVGGYIQEWIGWRANFFMIVILITFVTFILINKLPETHLVLRSEQMSFRKTIHQYQKILMSSSFLINTLCYAFAFSGLIAYFQVGPLLFIKYFHFLPSTYGWLGIIIGLSYFIGGSIVTKLVHRIGTKKLLYRGLLIMFIAGMGMLFVANLFPKNWLFILVFTIVYIIGARIVIPNASAQGFEEVQSNRGSVSAMMGCIQMSISMLVSFTIAHFSASSAIPLSLFWLGMSGLSLILIITMEINDGFILKFFYK